MRKLSVGQVDEVRKDMPLQVIDLHHGYVFCDGQAFGEGCADQQRTQKPGAAGVCDGIDIVRRNAGVAECRIHYGNDVLLVGARGQFGYYASVFYVNGLRGDYIGKQHSAAQYGCRSVVA